MNKRSDRNYYSGIRGQFLKREMPVILFLVLIFCSRNVSIADLTTKQAMTKFVSADFAYKDGDYEKAIMYYEAILEEGWESGPLYYNLGNSYFRRGKLGKAILYYERAERLIPRDSDLQFNMRYARSLVKHSGQPTSEKFFQPIMNQFISFYNLDEMVWMITTLLILMGIIFLLSLFLKWPQRASRFILGVTIVLVVVYMGGFLFRLNQQVDLAIVVSAVEAKFEPRQESTVHFSLSEGAKIKILKKERHWIKIQRLDDQLGWVPEETVEEI